MRSTIIFMRRPTRQRTKAGIHLLFGGDAKKYFECKESVDIPNLFTCYEYVDERHKCPPPVQHREGADKEQGEEDVEHEQQVGHRVRNSAVKELLSPEIEYYQKMGQPS